MHDVDDDACLACGSVAARRFAVDERQAIAVCTRCGLGRLTPAPDDAALDEAYRDAYGAAGAKFVPGVEAVMGRAAAREARSLLRRLATARPRIVDVGCGRGLLAGALAARGAEVIGVERSRAATFGIDPRVDVRVAARLADAGIAAGSVDAVVIRHVLEHLRDPRETLEEARALLRDGLLVVEVPNFGSWQARFGADWLHLDPPRHLWHFTASSLTLLLARAGFDVDEVSTLHPLHGAMGWLQSALNAAGRPRDALYRALFRGARRRPRDLVDAAAAAALLPLATALTALEATAGAGAVLSTTARPRQRRV